MIFRDYEVINSEVHFIVTRVNSDYTTTVISDEVVFRGTFEQCQLFIDTIQSYPYPCGTDKLCYCT